MFTYNAFIENTPEIREWCIKNDIRTFLYNKGLNDEGKYCKVFGGELRVYSCSDIAKNVDGIDCTGNPELFKAVVMVRDDSDYLQYFIGIPGDASDVFNWYYCMRDKIDAKYFRKASISELQEHFKLK